MDRGGVEFAGLIMFFIAAPLVLGFAFLFRSVGNMLLFWMLMVLAQHSGLSLQACYWECEEHLLWFNG